MNVSLNAVKLCHTGSDSLYRPDKEGYVAVGYANYMVIAAAGKFADSVSNVMNGFFKYVGYKKHVLSLGL